MKKGLSLLLSVVMLLSLVSGAFAEQRTVSFLHWRTEDKAAYQELIDKYEAEHPDVKVEMEIIATGDYDTTLLMRLQGGMVADVFATHLGGSYRDNVASGKLLNFVGIDSITSHFTSDAVNYFMVDDALYAAPQTTNAFSVYYNKDIFAQYGLEIPTTLDEFEAVCKTLKDNGVTPMAFAGGETWVTVTFFALMMANCVADDQIWFEIADGRKTMQDEPGFADCFCYVRKLREAGYILPESSGINEKSLLTGFAMGNYAMISTGTWSMSTIRNLNDACNFGLFNMPGTLGTDKGVSHIGLSLCVNKDSAVLDDAVDFAAYMCTPEAVASLCNATGQLTPVSDVTLDNADLAMALALIQTKDGFTSSPHRVPNNAAYDVYCAMTVEAVIADTFDVDERLAYYQGEIDKLNK